ncbi:hypothetical protein AQI96_01005 [Streptomyces canus]|nr:hypothetical protein AQI96_01005 [Streptomyces canus]
MQTAADDVVVRVVQARHDAAPQGVDHPSPRTDQRGDLPIPADDGHRPLPRGESGRGMPVTGMDVMVPPSGCCRRPQRSSPRTP